MATSSDRQTLLDVARTSLRTKLHPKLADHLTECIVDGLLTIRQGAELPDLHMVEIMVRETLFVVVVFTCVLQNCS